MPRGGSPGRGQGGRGNDGSLGGGGTSNNGNGNGGGYSGPRGGGRGARGNNRGAGVTAGGVGGQNPSGGQSSAADSGRYGPTPTGGNIADSWGLGLGDAVSRGLDAIGLGPRADMRAGAIYGGGRRLGVNPRVGNPQAALAAFGEFGFSAALTAANPVAGLAYQGVKAAGRAIGRLGRVARGQSSLVEEDDLVAAIPGIGPVAADVLASERAAVADAEVQAERRSGTIAFGSRLAAAREANTAVATPVTSQRGAVSPVRAADIATTARNQRGAVSAISPVRAPSAAAVRSSPVELDFEPSFIPGSAELGLPSAQRAASRPAVAEPVRVGSAVAAPAPTPTPTRAAPQDFIDPYTQTEISAEDARTAAAGYLNVATGMSLAPGAVAVGKVGIAATRYAGAKIAEQTALRGMVQASRKGGIEMYATGGFKMSPGFQSSLHQGVPAMLAARSSQRAAVEAAKAAVPSGAAAAAGQYSRQRQQQQTPPATRAPTAPRGTTPRTAAPRTSTPRGASPNVGSRPNIGVAPPAATPDLISPPVSAPSPVSQPVASAPQQRAPAAATPQVTQTQPQAAQNPAVPTTASLAVASAPPAGALGAGAVSAPSVSLSPKAATTTRALAPAPTASRGRGGVGGAFPTSRGRVGVGLATPQQSARRNQTTEEEELLVAPGIIAGPNDTGGDGDGARKRIIRKPAATAVRTTNAGAAVTGGKYIRPTTLAPVRIRRGAFGERFATLPRRV